MDHTPNFCHWIIRLPGYPNRSGRVASCSPHHRMHWAGLVQTTPIYFDGDRNLQVSSTIPILRCCWCLIRLGNRVSIEAVSRLNALMVLSVGLDISFSPLCLTNLSRLSIVLDNL